MPADPAAPPTAPRRGRARWIVITLVSVAAAIAATIALRPPRMMVVVVQPSTLVRTLQFSARVAGIATACGVLAAVMPARHAAALDPAQAIRL